MMMSSKQPEQKYLDNTNNINTYLEMVNAISLAQILIASTIFNYKLSESKDRKIKNKIWCLIDGFRKNIPKAGSKMFYFDKKANLCDYEHGIVAIKLVNADDKAQMCVLTLEEKHSGSIFRFKKNKKGIIIAA